MDKNHVEIIRSFISKAAENKAELTNSIDSVMIDLLDCIQKKDLDTSIKLIKVVKMISVCRAILDGNREIINASSASRDLLLAYIDGNDYEQAKVILDLIIKSKS